VYKNVTDNRKKEIPKILFCFNPILYNEKYLQQFQGMEIGSSSGEAYNIEDRILFTCFRSLNISVHEHGCEVSSINPELNLALRTTYESSSNAHAQTKLVAKKTRGLLDYNFLSSTSKSSLVISVNYCSCQSFYLIRHSSSLKSNFQYKSRCN